MLYHLLYPLRDLFFGFNVFRYITFRAMFASITAFLLSLLLGPLVIRKLREWKIGQPVRKEETPTLYPLHKDKEGTPTMGGILIVLSVVLSTLLWGDLTNMYVWITLGAVCYLALVGFLDDYLKIKMKKSKGMAGRVKFAGQLALGLVIGLIIYYHPAFTKTVDIPFFKDIILNIGAWYILLSVLVIAGTSNAVNLTDGLDGLAIGCVSIVALTYAIMSYVSGNVKFSAYLDIPYVAGSGELAVFCGGLVGAGLGFLWYNSHPASVFMGDAGSLALGGAIGIVSLIIKKELLLVIAGGIFVAEAVSVIMQTTSYKLRKKRIFKMAPLHHHFQLSGWHESKITIRFWIVAIILALLSLSTLKLR